MKEEFLIPAVATFVVGLIAGMVSLVASILAKDQKTSEFRQAWIDGLRDDVSQLVAHLGIMKTASAIIRGKPSAEIDAYLLEHQAEFVKFGMLASRIRLRLNPDEHAGLIELLVTMESFEDGDMDARLESIAVETQKVLKSEWERVKRGEPSFVWLKKISKVSVLTVVFLAIGVGGVTAAWHFGLVSW